MSMMNVKLIIKNATRIKLLGDLFIMFYAKGLLNRDLTSLSETTMVAR